MGSCIFHFLRLYRKRKCIGIIMGGGGGRLDPLPVCFEAGTYLNMLLLWDFGLGH